MASSVARMPGDDWPGLFAGSHAKHLNKIHLPKISISPTNHQPQFFHSPKPNSNSNSNPIEPDRNTDSASTPTKRHHHNQKILDRWAARQAREMVTTIERQVHEAELSALSNTTQPVSDRARRFLYRREPSPTPSDMSTCSAPAVPYGDVPQTVRASSLIQMWRDLEASTPRGVANGKQENAPWGDENEAVMARGLMVRPAVRGRGEIEELVARMERERRREIDSIATKRVVSQFPYRGRLQSILRLKFLRREIPDREGTRSPSSKAKLIQPQKSPKKISTRQSFNNNIPATTTDESSTNSIIDQTVDSTAESNPRSEFAQENDKNKDEVPAKDKNKDENHYQEEDLPPTDSSTSINGYYEKEYSHPPADIAADPFQDSSLSEQGESQSQCQSPESSSWEEKNLWLGSVDWQRSPESTTPMSWRGDVVPVEDLGAFPWYSDSPNSWRALVDRDIFENISDNIEIRDLLERKRVTSSLQSDFCTKMNRLILSILQRQGRYSVDDNFGEEEYRMTPYWRQKYELNNSSDQIATASSSLVPFQYHNNLENWQSTTFTNNVSDNSPGVESMAQIQIRNDMAQIHDEISELRKLVESCLQWQSKLHESIKLEVSNAISQAVSAGGQSIANSTCSVSEMKSKCGICNDAHVDSLLYRCGHMCACFKCARDLQSNGAKCPSCRSPIEDVVQIQ